jgi:hypothetical protein
MDGMRRPLRDIGITATNALPPLIGQSGKTPTSILF